MVVTELGISKLVNELQVESAYDSMVSTVLGITRLVKPQLPNACDGIAVIAPKDVISVNDLHHINASAPRVVTDIGILILLILECEKAPSSMVVTVSGISTLSRSAM